MIAGVLILIAIAAAVVLMAIGHVDGGYALLAWHDWSVETSIVALVLCVLILLALAYGLIRIVFTVSRLPGRVQGSVRGRRRRQAQLSFEDGLLYLLEGDWKKAETALVRHAADRDTTHLNYLAAARAAQHLGADRRRDHYLELAADKASDHDLKMAVLATRAELQREQGDYPALLKTAQALREEDPDNVYAVQLLADAFAEQGEWGQLDDLLEQPAARSLEAETRNRLRQRLLVARINQAVADGKLDNLKGLWRDAGDLRRRPEVAVSYVEALLHMGDETEAQALLVRRLDKDWDEDLVRLYGRLSHTDPMQRLSNTERWLQRYGERPALLEAAGRACLNLQMWGKAQSYLESLLRMAPSPQVYLDLAQLAESTQKPEQATHCYHKGLVLAARGVPAADS